MTFQFPFAFLKWGRQTREFEHASEETHRFAYALRWFVESLMNDNFVLEQPKANDSEINAEFDCHFPQGYEAKNSTLSRKAFSLTFSLKQSKRQQCVLRNTHAPKEMLRIDFTPGPPAQLSIVYSDVEGEEAFYETRDIHAKNSLAQPFLKLLKTLRKLA